jgi:hypothetical protein
LPNAGKGLQNRPVSDLVKLSVDVDGPVRGIRTIRDQALPFTIVRALTMTAQDAQQIVRQVERGVFKLRNDWTTRNTKITPATKEKMMAEVYTDTGDASAPDYLPRQQDGGERVPVGGHRYLAIPTDYLFKYTSRSRPIPDNLRPKAILPADAEIGATYAGSFSFGAGTARRVIGKRTLKKLGASDFMAFTQVTRSGSLCIMVRHGGGTGGPSDAEPWYLLIHDAHIRPVFPMTAVVTEVVSMNFEANFTRAAAEVAVNDALRGTGLTVKF